MPSTIADVARAAQVDKSTVSRALNGTGRVSPETLQRIVSAADALGYRPSKLARGFRYGSTATVGLLTPPLSAPGAADFASGVLAVMEEAGLSVIVAEAERDEQVLRSLDFPIDGVIIAPGLGAGAGRWLHSTKGPVVDGRGCTWANTGNTDEYAAALEAYRLMVRYGHHRIALVELADDVEGEVHAVRADALEDALDDSPLRMVGEARAHPYVIDTAAEAQQVVARILSEGLVSAVSLGSDLLVGPAVSAIQDAGRQVGRDLSLVAVMHSAGTRILHPRLAALLHNVREDGDLAARQLVAQLQPSGAVEDERGSTHWCFERNASIEPSPIVPNC